MRRMAFMLMLLSALADGTMAHQEIRVDPGWAVAYSYTGQVLVQVDREPNTAHDAEGWQRGLLMLMDEEAHTVTLTGQLERISLVDRAEAQAILSAGGEMGVYAVSITDEAGAPLSGVMVQVCDASSCRMEQTDEAGRILLTLPRFAYELHILRVPEGFVRPGEGYLMPEEGGRWEISLQKAN